MALESVNAEAYAVCKKRGHQPSDVRLMSNPPQDICRFCGVHYRFESVLIETNLPTVLSERELAAYQMGHVKGCAFARSFSSAAEAGD